MKRLEQYISRATRGLYGIKKLEIQAELRGSIEARIWQLEVQGSTNALETALLEMGAAKTINSGLIKEHLMPNISKAIFVVIAATTLTIAGISSSHAQISWAVPQDKRLKNCSCQQPYISLKDLKTWFEKAGATVTESMQLPELFETTYNRRQLPTGILSWQDMTTDIKVKTLDITFRNTEKPYQVRLQALANFSLNAEEKIATRPQDAEFIAFQYVIDQFLTTGLPIQFTGWQKPKMQLGNLSFLLERNGQMPNMGILYNDIFARWWTTNNGRPGVRNRFTVQHSLSGATTYPHRHVIRTKDPANTVYAIITSGGGFRVAAGADEPPTTLILARTNAQGILEFNAPFKVLEFGKNSLLEKTARADAGSEKNPAQALLYKFTGRIDDLAKPVEIVLPSKTKIAAIK